MLTIIRSIFATDKNPEFSFLDQSNSRLMNNLARMSLEKIYKQQPVPNNRIKVEFMTLEQVEERNRRAILRAKHRMQMPPIVQVKQSKFYLDNRNDLLLLICFKF